MAKGQRPQWRWVYDPKSKPGTKPSDALKREVSEAAEAILAEWRQQYIRPVPKDHQFNYLIAVYTRWHGNYFSFCGTYACPGPNAISPSYETGFARLERVGDKRFNLAYMRHTGRWWQTDQALPLSECITKISENGLYHPS